MPPQAPLLASWEFDLRSGTVRCSGTLAETLSAMESGNAPSSAVSPDEWTETIPFAAALDYLHPADRPAVRRLIARVARDGAPRALDTRVHGGGNDRDSWHRVRLQVRGLPNPADATGSPRYNRIVGGIYALPPLAVTFPAAKAQRVRRAVRFATGRRSTNPPHTGASPAPRLPSVISAVVSALPDVVYVYDLDPPQPVFSSRDLAVSLLGYPSAVADEVTLAAKTVDGIPDAWVHTDDRARRAEARRRLRDGEATTAEFTLRLTRRDGSLLALEFRESLLPPPEDRDDEEQENTTGSTGRRVAGIARDVTARRAADAARAREWDGQERRLREAEHRADHDPLTGLLNHRAFYERLRDAGEAARADVPTDDDALNALDSLDAPLPHPRRRSGRRVGVAMFDLDNFKFFNEAYGHQTGDDVLKAVANALRDAHAPGESLGRLGGDEFALLVPDVADRAALEKRAHALRAAVTEVLFQPDSSRGRIPLALSGGVALAPDDAPTPEAALAEADTLLAFAKRGGNVGGVVSSGGGELSPPNPRLRATSGGSSFSAVSGGWAESLRAEFSRTVPGFDVLDALISAADARDRYTRRHGEEALVLALAIGQAMGLSSPDLEDLRLAALIYDVGNIAVPARVLRRPGPLEPLQGLAARRHVEIGAALVAATPSVARLAPIVRHHHERWDGGGYPDGLAGEAIPRLARILAVADAFAALTSDRPYRIRITPDEADAVLRSGAGRQWDPRVVAAFERARATRASRSAVR